jgi:hypothetical protein
MSWAPWLCVAAIVFLGLGAFLAWMTGRIEAVVYAAAPALALLLAAYYVRGGQRS